MNPLRVLSLAIYMCCLSPTAWNGRRGQGRGGELREERGGQGRGGGKTAYFEYQISLPVIYY